MELVSLADPGIRLRQGYDAWNRDGDFTFRTALLKTVFRRRAAYFRVNSTGRVYRVVSRFRTVEVAIAPAAPRRAAG